MMTIRRIWFVTLLAIAMLLSLAPSAYANQADLRISLRGGVAFANAKGTAKYRDRSGEREFQVEVENVKALAGRTLSVFVGSVKVGSMKVTALGAARLDLNSTRGQAVPVIRSGSVVQVRTGTGTLVVFGRFP